MAQTLVSLLTHVIFSTKNREPVGIVILAIRGRCPRLLNSTAARLTARKPVTTIPEHVPQSFGSLQ